MGIIEDKVNIKVKAKVCEFWIKNDREHWTLTYDTELELLHLPLVAESFTIYHFYQI